MKTLFLSLFISTIAFGALPATAVFEVRTAGNAKNGGGFDSAGSGTDMSIFDNKNAAACTSCQSATVNISTADMTVNASTTIISATANFSSAIIGNIIYMELGGGSCVSGTVSAQWRYVSGFTNSTTVTVDATPSGSPVTCTGITINIGGALDSPTTALTTAYVAGTIFYFKAGTYSQAANLTLGTAGTESKQNRFIGYTTTRTDNGQATFQASATQSGMLSPTTSFWLIRNIIIDCNSQAATTRGVNSSTNNVYVYYDNMVFKNCTSGGYLQSGTQRTIITNSWATGNASGGFSGNAGSLFCYGCTATANTGPGFTSSASTAFTCDFCISAANTGGTTDGYFFSNGTTFSLINSVSYNNGRDGVRITTANTATEVSMHNNIIASNAGYGINSNTTNITGSYYPIDHNAIWVNAGTAARNNISAGTGDVTLSGDPFTNGGSNDFSLNNTAGAGASCRSAGFPGVLQVGGTGYIDMGALRHADPAGSGGQKSYTFLQ